MTTSEDAALLAEIERLSGQINQHRNESSAASAPRGRGGFRGRGGGGGWQRGRGGAAPAPVSRHRTLVINNGNNPSSSDAQHDAPSSSSSSSSWVRRKTTHNMSLVSSEAFEKTEPARIAALQASQSAKTAAKATARAAAKSKASASREAAKVRRGDNMGEVIIDGVVFVFDETGTKLVKKGSVPGEASAAPAAASSSSSSSSPSKAPLRTSVNGQSFIRTKRGNLISAELHQQRKAQKESTAKMRRLAAMGDQIASNEKTRSANRKSGRPREAAPASKGLCSFYNKTGQCKRGLSCPYIHDASRLAICPGALRPTGCSLPTGLCPLSHDATKPQRVPHCVHWLRSGRSSCRSGASCAYVHTETASGESPVCGTFARFGWCEEGAKCESRHTFDCPDFIEKGSCERKGCRLMHVVGQQAQAGGQAEATAAAPDGGKDGPSGPPPPQQQAQQQQLISYGKTSKRKRADEAEEAAAPSDEEGDDVAGGGGGLSFVPRKRKGKAAAADQRDYIGFDDEEEDQDDESEEEESDDDDDVESVSSGDEDDAEEQDNDDESSSSSSDSSSSE